MTADRREQERVPFCMEECRGTFTLEAQGEDYEVEKVTDVSLSGVGFEMSTFLEADTPLKITYEEDDIVTCVSGKIIWCEDHPTVHGSYQFGMLFDYSYKDENSQFLMAIRDYFDTMDGMDDEDELTF